MRSIFLLRALVLPIAIGMANTFRSEAEKKNLL